MSDLSPGSRVGEKRTISGVLHEWTGAVPPLDADSRLE
jgi:hypothetical protein